MLPHANAVLGGRLRIILHTDGGGGIWKAQASGSRADLQFVAFTAPR